MSIVEVAYSLILGIGLGLSIAAPPGPVNATIARDTVTRSRLSGMLVGFGAMTADAIFLVITLIVGSAVHLSGIQQGAIFILGAGVMFLMSFFTIRSFRERDEVLEKAESRIQHRSYIAGLTIGLTNPYQIFWWLTAGLSSINLFGPALIAGFFIGILLWIMLFPYLLDLGVKRFSKLYAAVMIFSIATLLIFAIWFAILGGVLLST
ncbi:MAG: LysE family transporter [Thermoplasmata archaeon]|nr:LysE family transporter [Thermoplasmata archaeon]